MKRIALGYGYLPRVMALGGEDYFIDIMKENQADHVEVTLEDVALAERLLKKGFTISLHCPQWWNIWKKGEETTEEWLLGLLNPLSDLSGARTFIWHSALALPEETSRSRLLSDSVSFFRFLRTLIAKTLGDAQICIENLTRGTSKTRIGDTPEELVELRREIGHDDVKFCFDIGHYIMGLRTLPDRTIPEEFLDNVAVVHLHGVEGKDRPREKWWDHYCLKENSIPWEGYLEAVLDRGWEGPIVLEFYRDLDEDPSVAREQMGGTFRAAREFLEEANESG